MRLPPTPCRVCFRPCVFNKFSLTSGKILSLLAPLVNILNKLLLQKSVGCGAVGLFSINCFREKKLATRYSVCKFYKGGTAAGVFEHKGIRTLAA